MTSKRKRSRPRSQIPHVHQHSDVTIELVDAFADASRREQLAALTELRLAYANDDHVSVLGATSLVVSAFLVLSVPLLLPAADVPASWLARVILAIVILAMLLIVCVQLLIDLARSHVRRERAYAWIAAYEAELSRRYGLRGRAARAWQRTH